uniref:Uncharacterized protein n=1 Tax=Arundo donax TaxID=35708 RepID=A0A0A9EZ01_ARUDO
MKIVMFLLTFCFLYSHDFYLFQSVSYYTRSFSFILLQAIQG